VVVTAKDAATVILLRDAEGPGDQVEVLMVRRHAKSRFVPDAYVFPGGRVEAADYDPELEKRCVGLDFEAAYHRLRDIAPPEKALGTYVAGIRETFEEAGIFLACDPSGNPVTIDAANLHLFGPCRRELHADRLSLIEILKKEGLYLAAHSLMYFSHWITPEASPIRYDVRFFVAPVPEGQRARHDGVELTGHTWITPRAALEGYAGGTFPIILPTRTVLAELAQFTSTREVVRSTEGKEVPAILTKMVLRDGQYVELLPHELREGE